MSKAFTKDDDDAGFVVPPSSAAPRLPSMPFHLTFTGARALAERADATAREAVARADVLPPQGTAPACAALGVTVDVVVGDTDTRRTYRLVPAEEVALLGEGCSVGSPIGRALLGAKVGDVREVSAPRGNEELTVVALRGEAS